MGIELAVRRIHRRIGMSGGLFVNALPREIGRELVTEEAGRLRRIHAEPYVPLSGQVRLLAAARDGEKS